MKSNHLFFVLLILFSWNPKPVAAQLGNLFGTQVSVPVVSAEELRKLQTDYEVSMKQSEEKGLPTPEPSFVIVDVRSEEEYKVSVIPGALPLEEFRKNKDDFKDKLIITYCTTGGRSHRAAEQLISEGFEVKNFKGSILGWCNSKYPLHTLEGQPTKQVHTHGNKRSVPEEYVAVE